MLRKFREGDKSFYASHPQRHHLPVPAKAQPAFPATRGAPGVRYLSRFRGSWPSSRCLTGPVLWCADYLPVRRRKKRSTLLICLNKWWRALLLRPECETFGRMFKMIETPQEGRGEVRAAVLLAKVQQIRIFELVCSGMWYCFLLHSASSYKCFSFSIRVTMAASARRQRPRRLLCWALVAVLLADLLALSGMYPAKVSKENKWKESRRCLLEFEVAGSNLFLCLCHGKQAAFH